MLEYRQVLTRMRLGDTDRSIARAGLMGRRKAAQLRRTAEAAGWLDVATALPGGRGTARSKLAVEVGLGHSGQQDIQLGPRWLDGRDDEFPAPGNQLHGGVERQADPGGESLRNSERQAVAPLSDSSFHCLRLPCFRCGCIYDCRYSVRQCESTISARARAGRARQRRRRGGVHRRNSRRGRALGISRGAHHRPGGGARHDDVDIVVLNEAPILLYHRVLRDGVRLLSRDLRATTGRAGQTLSRYFDFLPQNAAMNILDAGVRPAATRGGPCAQARPTSREQAQARRHASHG